MVAADVTLYFAYGAPLNMGVLASIFETNIGEVYSMSLTIFPVALVSLIVFMFLLSKSSIEMRRGTKIKLIYSLSFMIINLTIFPIVLVLVRQTSYRTFPEMVSEYKIAPLIFYSQVLSMKYPFVTGDIPMIASYFNEMAKFRSAIDKERFLPEGITYKENSTNPDKIILIMGESSSCMNYSLYGYGVKTTPFLDSLSVEEGLLTHYKNVIAPASFTREAVTLTMSFATPKDRAPFFDEKHILNIAKDKGYEIGWISNNGRLGVNDSYIGMIAATADFSAYRDEAVKDDLRLIPLFETNVKPGVRQFIVVHLKGSHESYRDKYDKVDTAALGSDGETIEYDKSIHHTDRTLSGIYRLVKDLDENVLIYYLSDHGEVVNRGHAIMNKFKDQFKIPLILIQNRPFMDTDSIINKYYDNEGRLNSVGTPYILSEIMGYDIPNDLVEKSKEDGKYILQPDGSVILYNNIVN